MTNEQVLIIITILSILVAMFLCIILSKKDEQIHLYEKLMSKLIDDNVMLAEKLLKLTNPKPFEEFTRKDNGNE